MNAKIEDATFVEQPANTSQNLFAKIKCFWRADFLSPKDLVRRAFLLAVLYCIASAFGLREFTSILNGTIGSVALGWHMSMFLGLLYIFSYLAFVLGTPTLLIAAGILVLWKRIVK